MTGPKNEAPQPCLGPWVEWVLGNVQSGLLVLDEAQQVVFANPWLLRRARLDASAVQGRSLWAVFPSLEGSHFQRALRGAVRTGFPAVLSETLHLSPLPLFHPASAGGDQQRLKQSIQIVPMGAAMASEAGQRYVLVQVTDVSPAVARERLLKQQAERMHAMAHVDALMDIGNRRHFDAMLDREWRHAMRERQRLSLVLFDIDHFKQYNDAYGHQRGDACLKTVASVIEGLAQRPRDVVCRYGGEEIGMLLPDTDLDGARALAQQVVAAVRREGVPHVLSQHEVVTVSAGVASEVPEPGMGADTLLLLADRALYQAKRLGRDRVEVLPPASSPTREPAQS